MQNGYKVKNLTGGYKSFSQGNFKAKLVNMDNNSNGGEEEAMDKDNTRVVELDACGLCCPGPLMQVKSSMDRLNNGDVLKIKASDAGFYEDIKAWGRRTGNEVISVSKECGLIYATLKKGNSQVISTNDKNINNVPLGQNDGKTMVVFSGDLDKAIASFIIANGAASMGKKVTMFFTFWGLNILRKPEKVKVKKNVIEKAFGMMMPRGSKKLGLSNMNMGGMGAKMIRMVMKDKNIQSLEDLMKAAIDNGVNIVACTMSMDVMGISKEELIDGVNFGGVGYYLGEADEANVNLFI